MFIKPIWPAMDNLHAFAMIGTHTEIENMRHLTRNYGWPVNGRPDSDLLAIILCQNLIYQFVGPNEGRSSTNYRIQIRNVVHNHMYE